MANEEQLAILRQGVEVWNKWREINLDTVIDLKGANLTRVDLPGADLSDAMLMLADLSGANLPGVDFSRAFLSWADLSGAYLKATKFLMTDLTDADLKDADLSDADIFDTDFKRAKLSNAKLINANLNYANLLETNLIGTDFTGSKIANVIFGNNDLSASHGIDTVEHINASTVGTNTIQKSSGRISNRFLDGCGLKDWEIESAKLANLDLNEKEIIEIARNIRKLRTGITINYYSCFISYNSKDEEFAKQLHNDLQDNDVLCWFAPEDMKIGDQIRPRIDQEIRLRDKFSKSQICRSNG